MIETKSTWLDLLKLSSQQIPAPFWCVGCELHCWSGICRSCIESVCRNSDLIDSSSSGIEAFAPLLYSFQQTHRMLKAWKANPGNALERLLFQMKPELRNTLSDLEFDAIVPIPQSFRRSWQRGHASAERVARFFSHQLEVPMIHLLELKTESVQRQAALGQFEREFAGSPFQMAVQNEVRVFSKILLIDDLITSGNTLVRAAEEIQTVFPEVKIWAGSLAFRPKRSFQF